MEWLMGGGPIMVPIFICSVIALAVILERMVSLRRSRIMRSELIEVIEAVRRSHAYGTRVKLPLYN